jgi:hypothetical protein
MKIYFTVMDPILGFKAIQMEYVFTTSDATL